MLFRVIGQADLEHGIATGQTVRRANRKGTLEAGDVRREVLDLQRQNRDLRREFDALKKKVEAGNAPAPAKKK